MAGIEAQHLDFAGRRVLVTGAAGGLGSRMARAFHAHRAAVVLADRGRAPEQARLASLGAELRVGAADRHAFDQADPASVEALARAAEPVDVLLNNAGVLHVGPFLEMTPDAIERLIATNLTGPVLLARAVARGMAARGSGVIVNTASQIAFTGGPERAIYGTAKAGLVQFTRAAAAELAPHGVRVAALAPGRTPTPLTEKALADPDYLAASLARIPAGRLGDPDEMARLALFLASPLADYVVGETLIADGGYILA